MSEDEFVGRICRAIERGFKISKDEATPYASQAYHDFGMETRFVRFGHAAYSWDEDAAQTIAEEFVLRFGEST